MTNTRGAGNVPSTLEPSITGTRVLVMLLFMAIFLKIIMDE
jgi:hypothetical protein